MKYNKGRMSIEDYERHMADAEARFYSEGRSEGERWWSSDPRSADLGEYEAFWEPFESETGIGQFADFCRIFRDQFLGEYFQEICRSGLLLKAEKTTDYIQGLSDQRPTLYKYLSSTRRGWYTLHLLRKWFEGWSQGVRTMWSDDVLSVFLCN